MSDPGPGSILGTPAAPVTIDVLGPLWLGEVISGTGSLGGADSWLAYEAVGSDLSIEGWSMREDASTTIGTSSLTSNASTFGLDLIGATVARAKIRMFRIDPGDGLFHLLASVDGVSDYAVATNSTRLDFYYVAGESARARRRSPRAW